MRLIDADALGIGKANRDCFDDPKYADGWNSAIEIINNAPTIEVKDLAQYHMDELSRTIRYRVAEAEPVRHGRWIKKQEKDTFAGYLCSYECSECGRIEKCREPYCNCGAKMDGESHD